MLIIVFGIASVLRLPLRELPDVDTSVVTVTTEYTGANPATVDTDITEIIESGVAGISGIKTISSQSRQGVSSTTIEFEVGRNIDEAANDVSAVAGSANSCRTTSRSRRSSRTTRFRSGDAARRHQRPDERCRDHRFRRSVRDRPAGDARRRGERHDQRTAALRHADLARPHRHGGPQHHGGRCRAGAPPQQCRAARRRGGVAQP